MSGNLDVSSRWQLFHSTEIAEFFVANINCFRKALDLCVHVDG